jgi:tetratricopeptide (TPR) repeat protein
MKNSKSYDDLLEKVKSECDSLDATIDYLGKRIIEDPNFLEAYLIRGEAYEKTGNFPKALNDFEKAVKINPDEAIAYNSRGRIFVISGGDINKALNDFSKAIELDAGFADAYSNRANTFLKMGEPQKAINDCTKAIEISPNESFEPYYNRGLAYVNIGEIAKALADYNMVIKLAPENAEAYAKRGMLNSQSGNTQEAIGDYEKFLELDPDNKNAALVRDEIKQLRSGNASPSDESFKVIKAKKEIKFIIIGSIIGAIAGFFIAVAWWHNYDDILNRLIPIWVFIGWGGNINLIPTFYRFGRNILNIFGISEAGRFILGVLAVFFLFFWASAFTGPIWPLIRILIKKYKMKKNQN